MSAPAAVSRHAAIHERWKPGGCCRRRTSLSTGAAPPPAASGRKPPALLGRQALETAIDERFPELKGATGKARNLCLPVLLGDEALARDLVQSWGALSHATHHHAYDLPPTAEELKRWMAPVAALVEANGSHVQH